MMFGNMTKPDMNQPCELRPRTETAAVSALQRQGQIRVVPTSQCPKDPHSQPSYLAANTH